MKSKRKSLSKKTLSDKIADALTVKSRADIEDDHVFGTKPKTLSRADLGSSDSEDEAAISDFRKRNINLLSEVSKKYEGQVVSRKDLEESDDENSDIGEPEYSRNGRKVSENSSDVSDNVDFNGKYQSTDKKDILKSKLHTESENSSQESDDYSITNFKKQLESDGDDQDEDDEGSSDAEGDENGYDISQMEEPMKEEFEHVKKQNISEEAKKGICVRNQLLVWENLLEMRIHLQRCINTANQLPFLDIFEELKKDEEFVNESKNTKANVANVLDKLLALQNLLLKNYPETKLLASVKNKQESKTEEQKPKEESDEEIPSDTDNEEIPSDTEDEEIISKPSTHMKESIKASNTKKRKLEDYESELSCIHKAFKPFRDTSIEKWNDKTRLATANNIKNAPTNTILQQISYILSDREKLIRRTQLKRSEYDIIGHKKIEEKENGDASNPVTKNRKDDDEYIPEIFDDSDFYHQLLRELIECKSADISDPVQLSRQWIALQQMRSKMKRKVDTKATKGRKIKYVVHNKLVNFMAPEKCMKWTDESANELYISLFGKMFEHNNAGLDSLGNVFKLQK